MQKGNQEPPLSLSQRAYLLAESLKSVISSIAIFFLLLLGYFILGIVINDPLLVLLTYAILASPFLIWLLIKSHSFYRELKVWNDQYLQNAYVLVFDTTVPKGNSTAEKVLSLTSLIFPQLRADYIDYYYVTNFVKLLIKKKFAKPRDKQILASMNYSVNNEYSVDLALKTLDGYFIVKDFKDKVVSIEDLKFLVNLVSRKFRNKYLKPFVFRIIVVAKDYDQLLYNRESLERIISSELKTKLKIDLVLEEPEGYSALWVS